MSSLDRIGVRVESLGAAAGGAVAAVAGLPGIGGGVAALAYEIAERLERLAAGGDPGMIDLRSLPMTTADRLRLQNLLGTGEVVATIDAEGISTLRETAIDGVWWSEYRDPQGELLAEVIEICRIPDILMPELADLATAAARLRTQLGTRT